MKNKLIALLLLLSWSILASADWLDPSELATDAASLGIGAIEGFATSSATIFQNPASLAKVKNSSFSAFKTTVMDDTNYANLAFAYRSPWGVIGAGLIQLSVADIPNTGVNQFGEYESLGDLNYLNSVYYLSYAPNTGGLGYSLKYYSAGLGAWHGSAINLDVGTVFSDFVYKGLSVSATAKNILSMSKFSFNDGTSIELPLKIVLGTNYRLSDAFQVYGQLTFLKTQTPLTMKALGLKVTPSFLPFLGVYAGWLEQAAGNLVQGRLTYGLELNYQGVSLAYAYEKTDYLLNQNNHYVSLGINL